MKSLDILYLFWRAQQQGRGIAELEINRPNEVLKDGIDADSWRSIHDAPTKAQWLKRLDRGHYLLSRNLHEVTLAMLADIMCGEPDYHLNPQHLGCQKDVFSLLRMMRDRDATTLNRALAALFGEGESN